jgi:hypothetical protein
MRNFIQGFAAWGMGDAIAGLITLVLSFALGEAQKPFDWLLLCALLLSITVWWLVFGLTVEAAPKNKSGRND